MLHLWSPWRRLVFECGAWAESGLPPCTSSPPCQAGCSCHSATSTRYPTLTEDVLKYPHSDPHEYLLKQYNINNMSTLFLSCSTFAPRFFFLHLIYSFFFRLFISSLKQVAIPSAMTFTSSTPLSPIAIHVHNTITMETRRPNQPNPTSHTPSSSSFVPLWIIVRAESKLANAKKPFPFLTH